MVVLEALLVDVPWWRIVIILLLIWVAIRKDEND